MRSLRFLLSRRWVFFTLFVAALVYGTWWAGAWQHGRLERTKHSNVIVAANLAAPPAPVDQLMTTTAPVDGPTQWRRITATGTYDVAHTLVWRYLTDDHSQSGVDQVVPFRTAAGTTLLVDRGWVASSDPTVLPSNAPTPPAGTVTVVGWVRQSASGGDATDVGSGGFRSLDSAAIGAALHRSVYDGFVNLQTENGATPAVVGQVDMPDPRQTWVHFFYWLQWWLFGVIAIFGYGYLMWDDWRTQELGRERDDDESDRKRRSADRLEQKQRVKAAYQAAYEAEKAQR